MSCFKTNLKYETIKNKNPAKNNGLRITKNIDYNSFWLKNRLLTTNSDK